MKDCETAWCLEVRHGAGKLSTWFRSKGMPYQLSNDCVGHKATQKSRDCKTRQNYAIQLKQQESSSSQSVLKCVASHSRIEP